MKINARLKTLISLTAILLVVGLALSPALFGEELTWDDGTQVFNNRDIKDFSLDGVAKIFSSFYVGMYQPLASLSYQLEYRLAGDNPTLYHFDNWLIHLINVILVYCLTVSLFKKRLVGLTTALLFGLWPTQVEPVVWISARSTLLASAMILACLLAWQKFLLTNKRQPFFLSLFFLVLGLLCKSVAASAVPLILILNWRAEVSLKKTLKQIWPFFLTVLAAGAVAILARHNILTSERQFEQPLLLNVPIIIGLSSVWQLLLLINPFNPSPLYPHPYNTGKTLPEWRIIFASLTPVWYFMTAYLLYLKKFKRTLFVFLWFIAAISPSILITPYTPFIGADRYNYLAILALLWPLSLLFNCLYKNKKAVSSIAGGGLVACLGIYSFGQAQIWQNNEKLWSLAVSKYPNSIIAWDNVSLAHINNGQWELALAELDELFKRNSEYYSAFNNRGYILMYHFQNSPAALKQAEADFLKALEINPYAFKPAANLTEIYFKRKDYQNAFKFSELALANNRNSTEKELSQLFFINGYTACQLKNWSVCVRSMSSFLNVFPDDAEALAQRGIARFNQNDNNGCDDLKRAVSLGNNAAAGLVDQYCR